MDSTDDMEYSFTLSELMKRNYDDDDDDDEIENSNRAIEISNGAIENKDDWFKDRGTYELRFNQLQEQLVEALVENQQLGIFVSLFIYVAQV